MSDSVGWIKLKYLTFIYLLLIVTLGCRISFAGNGPKVFRVASYNVENLFDLYKDGTEYAEYVPGIRSSWNKKTAGKKYTNISKVIAEINAEIVALQEVESVPALEELTAFLKKRGAKYPFLTITDQKKSAVECALLSKFRIIDSSEIKPVNDRRSILKVTVDVSGHDLVIYINHWPSKKFPESSRVEYAMALMQDIKRLPKEAEYIIVGDLNSNYNEFITIKTDRKLNDTGGKTGINHILKTTSGSRMNRSDSCLDCLYNLWMETEPSKRWSYIYRKMKVSLDNMIVPYTLDDGKGIDFVEDSFGNFMPDYLLKRGYIYRWQITGKGHHMGRGFSDHLPVYADFSIENE